MMACCIQLLRRLQAQYGTLMEPQNTSIPIDNSSHAALSQPVGAAELTAINTDDADELQQLDTVQQPNLTLQGVLPNNLSSTTELLDIDASSAVEQSDSQAPADASVLSSASSSREAAEASDALQDSQAGTSGPVHAGSNQTHVPNPSEAESVDPSGPALAAKLHDKEDEQTGNEAHQSSQPETLAPASNLEGDAQPQSSTGFSPHAQTEEDAVHEADVQPQSGAGFSTDSQQHTVSVPDEGSTPTANTNSTEGLPAAVFNQTLVDDELAALTELVRSKNRSSLKPLLPLQDVGSSGSKQDDNADDVLQPGTPDRTVEDTLRQSGHAEAYERIMESIPDFIRNADSVSTEGSDQGPDQPGSGKSLPVDTSQNASNSSADGI